MRFTEETLRTPAATCNWGSRRALPLAPQPLSPAVSGCLLSRRSPEAPEAAWSRPAGLASAPLGGGMQQPQPYGWSWGPGWAGQGFNPKREQLKSCCAFGGGFILEKKAPPSRPFFPLGRLTLMTSPVALDLHTSFTLPSAPARRPLRPPRLPARHCAAPRRFFTFNFRIFTIIT